MRNLLKIKVFSSLLAAAYVFAASASASAAPLIVKNLATGIADGDGSKIAYGGADSDYQVSEGAPTALGLTPVTYAGPSSSGGWLDDSASPSSRWISIPGSNNANSLETFFFQTTFSLSLAESQTARIEGFRFAADNQLIAIAINETSIFSAEPVLTGAFEYEGFSDLGALGSGLFVDGLNSITFSIFNGQHEPGTNPMGFRSEGFVVSGAVPEPSTATLLTVGTLLGLTQRRRVRG